MEYKGRTSGVLYHLSMMTPVVDKRDCSILGALRVFPEQNKGATFACNSGEPTVENGNKH